MGHKNKLSLIGQIKAAYDSKLAIGESKHRDKAMDRQGLGAIAGVGTRDKIYSWDTYRTYLKQACQFGRYCKQEHGCKTLEQCRQYVDEYLQGRAGLSAYTLKLDASALAKLYGCRSTDFAPTRERTRPEITRSRGEHGCRVRDRHFSEIKNRDLVEFCRSTGLRRSELLALRGDKLVEQDGRYYIRVDAGSKGGRHRMAPVIGNVEHVRTMMRQTGSGKVFDHIPQGADIHSYRADYAKGIYRIYARDIADIPYDRIHKGTGQRYQSQVYHCRRDQAGVKYDRLAMMEASRALGHNRISVVGEHYLYNR